MTIRSLLVIGTLSFLLPSPSLMAQGKDSIWRIPTSRYVSNVEFSRDGNYFLAQDRDTLRVWELVSRQPVSPMIKLTTSGYSAFLPGDSTILTVAYGSDSTFKVWEWRTGRLLREVKLYRTIQEASLSKDGRYLSIRVGYPEQQYELWNVDAGTYNKVLVKGNAYSSLMIDSLGEYGIFNIASIRNAFRLNIGNGSVDSLHIRSGDLFLSSTSPDRKRVGYARLKNPPLVFDVETLDSLFALNVQMDAYTRVTMGFSPDNRLIATVTFRRVGVPTLDLWSGIDGAHIREIGADTNIALASIRVSPHGDYVVLYDIAPGILMWPIKDGSVSVPAVAGIRRGRSSIYPSPAHDHIGIRWSRDSTRYLRIRLIDARGSLIRVIDRAETQGFGQYISVDELKSGLYFCLMDDGASFDAVPFIVEH